MCRLISLCVPASFQESSKFGRYLRRRTPRTLSAVALLCRRLWGLNGTCTVQRMQARDQQRGQGVPLLRKANLACRPQRNLQVDGRDIGYRGAYYVFRDSSSPTAPSLSEPPPAPAIVQTPAPPAPSFNCAKARSKPEHLICSDAELASLDHELGILYSRAKYVAPDKVAFSRENQIEWQRRENTCRDKACLVDWYATRRAQLQKTIDTNASIPSVDTSEVSQASVQRARDAISEYASQHEETEQQFYDRTRSTQREVVAFILTAQKYGASADDALRSIDGLSNALQDPDRAKVLECDGIQVYDPPRPKPSDSECTELKRRFGIVGSSQQ